MAGRLAVISGFSGAGKGTVVSRMMEEHEEYALSVSMTTRAPRNGEVHGREYHFVEREAFEDLIRNDGFIEYAEFTDCCYGTPRAFVEENLRAGRSVLLEIEVQGAMQIREKYPEAVLIFVTPPDAAELERRLVGRGADSADKITRRLSRAIEETEYIKEYPYLVINDDIEACARSIHSIICGEYDAARGREKSAPAGLDGMSGQSADSSDEGCGLDDSVAGCGLASSAAVGIRSGQPEEAWSGAGRVITDAKTKEAVAQSFREELPGVLARRKHSK